MATYKYDKTTGELTKIAGGTLYADSPVGSILPFGGTAIPTGWLACSGQAISRTDYADLFEVIGTYYGSGNGTTTFNVPDLREATVKGTGLSGKSNAHYSVGGITLGQFIDDQIQGHWHDVVLRQQGGSKVYVADENLDNYNSDSLFGTKTRNVATDPISDGTNGTPRTGKTTEVKAVGVNWIIKAKQTPMPADFIAGVKSMSSSTVGNNTKLVTGEAVYNFNYRAKDTSITSDWIAIDNVASDWATSITSLQALALRLGKRRDVYINFSPANAESAKTNGLFPSYFSGKGGLLHMVTGLTDTYGRGFAEYLSEDGGDAIFTARTNNWVNSWYWVKGNDPQVYSAIGTIFTGNTIRGYGKSDVTLYANGKARVDYAIEITTSYVANEFGYGISPDALHSINSNIPVITPQAPDPSGNYLWYINGTGGIIKRNSLGYGSTHGRVNYNNKLYWQLGRIYNTSATYGGWPTSEFAVGDYITGTCWGTFIV